MKLLFARFFLVSLLVSSALVLAQESTKESIPGKKPRVMVITSGNGGGHNSAADAVMATLGSEYEVFKVDLLKEKLAKGLDKRFMKFFAEENWKMVNFLQKFMTTVDFHTQTRFKGFIEKKITEVNPDLVVSVFPIGNKAYSQVAKKLGTKNFIAPTDLEMSVFLRFFKKSENNNHTVVCRAYENPNDDRLLKEVGLYKNSYLTGYPVRPQFNKIAKLYRNRDEKLLQEFAAIKEKMNIQKKDQIVLIAPIAPIGARGAGKQAVLDYINMAYEEVDTLLPPHNENEKNNGKIHFLVVTGKNEELFQIVEQRARELKDSTNSRVVIHPIKFLPAEDYAKHIAMANVAIVKPGGATINEMIAMGKKVLIKSDSAQALPWERANLNFMVKKGWGVGLKYTVNKRVNRSDYISKLKDLFQLPENYQTDSPVNNFEIHFKKLVDEYMSMRKRSENK